MDGLEIPHDLARARVHAHEALRIEVVARAMAPVVIARPRLHRQIDVAQVEIRRERRPDGGVPGVVPGSVFPRLVAGIAGLRDRVEGPELLARPRVESPHVTRRHLLGRRTSPLRKRGSDDDHISDDDRGRTRADAVVHQIQVPPEPQLEVHDPVVAEGRVGEARLRVQRDHVIGGGDEKHPFFDAIRPVTDAAPGVAARRVPAAFTLVEPVHPERLPRLRIDRHRRPPESRGGIEGPVRVQRGHAVVALGGRTEVARLPAPRDLQVLDVRGVDLIERRVARGPGVSGPVAPFSVHRPGLGGERERPGAESRAEHHQTAQPAGTPVASLHPFHST